MRRDPYGPWYPVLLAGMLVGCGSSGAPSSTGEQDADVSVEPVECNVEAPTSCPDPPPRYADVEPIFQERCVGCHDGAEDGPWPLTSYSHAADWHDIIRAAMLDCTMPPPESGMTMTTAERETLLNWLRCGFPK